MQDAKEEIRSRLNIEDVIGEYVRLKRAGRSFKGLSPFTQEKTPSFTVSPDKHVWYDFSSNQGGDIFNFIMTVEGLDFKGAMELLARKAGVDLSLYQNQSPDLSKKKERLYALLEVATHYFHQTLRENKKALAYVFTERSFNPEAVQKFRIGYAPDTASALVDFLKKRGYLTQEIRDAGLMNSRGGDLFRARMIVPLMDGSGRVIGFTGRLLADIKNAPKYLNTPQTLLYDKSRHVFGLHLAKESIRKEDAAVLVEGNLDVVSSHQFGVSQVVATAGTALTEFQLKSLQRLSGNVVLAFDNDRAGLAATERTIPIAQKLGIVLKVAVLPEGFKDPDEVVRKDAEVWRRAIRESLPVVEWVMYEYERRHDLSTAEGKKAFSTAVIAVLESLGDAVEKEHYERIMAQKLGVSIEAVQRKVDATETTQQDEVRLKKISHQAHGEVTDGMAQQDMLLSLAVSDPSVRSLLVDIEPKDFTGQERQLLVHALRADESIVFEGELSPELQQIETYVKVMLLQADEKYSSWNSLERYDETARLIKLIKNNMKQQTKRSLTEKLRLAEAQGNNDEATKIRAALNTLIKEMKK